MESDPVTEMLCLFGVLDSGNCLQTASLTNVIKIHSVIGCMHIIMKSEYYFIVTTRQLTMKFDI